MSSQHISLRSGSGGGLIGEPAIPGVVHLATTIINVLALALPLSILQVYDRIIPNHSRQTLAYIFAGLVLTLVLDFVLKYARYALLCWQSMQFVSQFEREAIARYLRAPEKAVENEPATVRINRHAALTALGDYHHGQASLTAIDLPFVVIGIAVLSLVGGAMVLVPTCLFFLFAALAVRRNREFREIFHDRTIDDNKKYDFVAEALTGIHTIKGMAMEPQMQRRFERLQQAVAEGTMSSIVTGNNAQTAAFLYGSVTQIVVVAFGASLVLDDKMSIGALACCTLLSGQVLQPLLRAISLWNERELVRHRRAEVRELMNLPVVDAMPASGTIAGGDIELRDVTFRYAQADHPVLVSVNVRIPKGVIVGVKGNESSGRSTLLKLLSGEILPSTGQVTIDEIATDKPQFQGVRKSIATVSAAPVTFSGTILENLTMFQPERRSLARAMAAICGLDAAINLMPDGFETRIGDGMAESLPPSTMQQICIVRALSMAPKLLILNEANSVLDRDAETRLIQALKSLRGQLTIVIVTHRPSLLAISDRVLLLDAGRVEWEA